MDTTTADEPREPVLARTTEDLARLLFVTNREERRNIRIQLDCRPMPASGQRTGHHVLALFTLLTQMLKIGIGMVRGQEAYKVEDVAWDDVSALQECFSYAGIRLVVKLHDGLFMSEDVDTVVCRMTPPVPGPSPPGSNLMDYVLMVNMRFEPPAPRAHAAIQFEAFHAVGGASASACGRDATF